MTHLIELRYLQANGIRMRVAIAGDGPNVLLLHGWPFTWFLWRQLLPTLAAAGYRAIAPNLRGIAETERPAAGYEHTVPVHPVRAGLDTLGRRRARRAAVVAALVQLHLLRELIMPDSVFMVVLSAVILTGLIMLPEPDTRGACSSAVI